MKKSDFKKRPNPVHKDLRTPKYKMRVVLLKKIYKRKDKHVKHEL